MKVTVTRETPELLSFEFTPDEVDAVVAVPKVWFRFEGANAVKVPRVALMAYLMVRSSIGNAIELDGATIPSYLGARFAHDQGAHEFFMGPVNNTPERILPEFRYDALVAGDSDLAEAPRLSPLPEGKVLQCRRTELGYVLEDCVSSDCAPLQLSTNVDLLAAFTPEPRLLALILIYLCAFDVLGVRALRVRNVDCDSAWAERVASLCAEVGALVSIESIGSSA